MDMGKQREYEGSARGHVQIQAGKSNTYLEAIFASPDIQQKLPNEAKLFEGIDKAWKDIMKKVKENPIAIGIGTRPGLLEMFQKHNENLDVIQKNLELYLETCA